MKKMFLMTLLAFGAASVSFGSSVCEKICDDVGARMCDPSTPRPCSEVIADLKQSCLKDCERGKKVGSENSENSEN